MSEWTEWNGGECPVAPDTLVEVRWRNGDMSPGSRADTWSWTHTGVYPIIAYRVVKETAPQPVTDTITATLTERGKRYGVFSKHAEVTQAIKHALFNCRARGSLAPDQVEALEMIAHKLGRIVNGDPDYADSWVDIAGYSKLVADRLQGMPR